MYTHVFEVPLATNVGGSTNVCVIRSWELFGANGFSQKGKPSSYLGAHLSIREVYMYVLGLLKVKWTSVPIQTSSTELT